MSNKYKDTSPLALGRQQKGSSVQKAEQRRKKKQEEKRIEAKSTPQSSSNYSANQRTTYRSSGGGGQNRNNTPTRQAQPRMSTYRSVNSGRRSTPQTAAEMQRQREEAANKSIQRTREARFAREQQRRQSQKPSGVQAAIRDRQDPLGVNQQRQQSFQERYNKENPQTAEEARKVKEREERNKSRIMDTKAAPSYYGASLKQEETDREKMQETAIGRIVSNAPERVIEDEKKYFTNIGIAAADVGEMLNGPGRNKNGRLAQDMEGLLPDSNEMKGKFGQSKRRLIEKRDEYEAEAAARDEGAGRLEKNFYSAEESGAGMLTDQILGFVTAPVGGWRVPLFLRSYGGSLGKAEELGATTTEDRLNAAKDGIIEVATESIGGFFGRSRGGKFAKEGAGRFVGRNFKSAFKKFLRVGAEEHLEEVIANPLEHLGENLIFRNRLQAEREAQNDDYFNEIAQSIQEEFANDPTSVQRYIAEVNSPDTRESFVKDFKEGGMTDEQAGAVADKMIEFMVAAAQNDTDKMKAIKDSLDEDLVGDMSMKVWDWNEQLDLALSTWMVSGVGGANVAYTSYQQGQAIKSMPNANQRMEHALEKVAAFDPDNASKSKAMLDAMRNEGYEPTATQAYDIMAEERQVMSKVRDNQVTANQVKQNGVKRERLTVPVAEYDDTGEYRITGKVSTERYAQKYVDTLEMIQAIDDSSYEMQTSREEAMSIAEAVASFDLGTMSIAETARLTQDHPENRYIFKEMTGVDLDQYNVKNKNGEIDPVASNLNMQKGLLALAADRYIESARIEQFNWNDEERGRLADEAGKGLDPQGDLALHDALDSVDPRDYQQFMLMGRVAQDLYAHAYYTQDSWEDVKRTYEKLYPSLNIGTLQGMYDSAKADRDAAETPYLNAEVEAGEKLGKVKSGKKKGQARGRFINEDPFNEDTGEGRDLKGSELAAIKQMAQDFNVDIIQVAQDDERLGVVYTDENGEAQYRKDSKGNTVKANASVDFRNHVIYISSAAPIEKVLHEIVHETARLAAPQYIDMAHYILNAAYKYDAAGTRAMIEDYKQRYRDQNLTDAQIEEEVVADLVATYMHDPKFVRAIANENLTALQKIKNAIDDVIRAIRNFISSGHITDENQRNSLLNTLGIYTDVRDMMVRVYREAANAKAAEVIDDKQAEISDTRYSTMKEMWENDEKLSHSRFNSWYSAHKLNLRGRDDLEAQIEDIRENGFITQTAISNVMPASVNDYDDMNWAKRTYGARKGDTVLLVPRPFVDLKDDRVISGFRPRAYEIVKVERDFQPYYELYSKAYDEDHGEADVRFSISPEQDSEYMDTAEEFQRMYEADDIGWLKLEQKLQKMVDEAAIANGYNIKAYHGTDSEPFNVFDRNKLRHGRQYGDGFYFSPFEDYAGLYGNEIREYYLRGNGMTLSELFERPAAQEHRDFDTVEEAESFFDEKFRQFEENGQGIERFRPEARKIDGKYRVIYTTIGSFQNNVILVATEPEYIKSADPITYDDEGNIIPLSERFNEESQDIRFSLSEPVERVKDLIAVHNLKPTDIKNAFELGGFPMPSIAVTKDSLGHDIYGDITLMFHSDTIDPGTSRHNQVFGGDAWTPTFPDISKKFSRKKADEIYDYLKGVLGIEDEYKDLPKGIRMPAMDDDNLRNKIGYNEPGEAFWHGYGSEVMKLAYLKAAKNFDIAIPTKEGTIRSLNRQALEHLDDKLPADLTYDDIYDTVQHTMEYEPAVREARKAYYESKGGAKLKSLAKMLDEEMGYSEVLSRLEATITFRKEGMPEVIDDPAFQKILGENIDREEYAAWVNDLFDGIVEKVGIRNDRDPYTNNGRRSWEQLHDPVTLDNVVRAMRKELAAGSAGFLGTNPMGAAQKSYKSLDEIRADEDRLQMLPSDEYDGYVDAARERFKSVCEYIVDENPKQFEDRFGAVLDVGTYIAEVINKTKSKPGIQRKLKQEYMIDVSDTHMDYLMEAIDEIANLPTGYFEAKPRRAVGFNEVKAAIIPAELKWTDTLYDEIRSELELMEIPIYEYAKSKWGDRQRVVNEAATDLDLRFSIAEDSTGRSLSEDQQRFFNNSKVLDDEGRLKVMYHGTPNIGFTVFDYSKAKPGTLGRGFYFTDSPTHASNHGQSIEVYLNITNPLTSGTNNITKDQLRAFVERLAEDEDYGIENYGYGSTVDSVTDSVWGGTDFQMMHDLNLSCVGDLAEACRIFNEVNGTDYDGIITPVETLAMRPEQIKFTDNLAPTSDPDMRYSIDEEYMKAVEDGDMETAAKLVETAAKEAGYGVHGYHGTHARFTVFDTARAGQNWGGDSRLGPGLYFAHDRDTAQAWSKGSVIMDSYLSMGRPLDYRKSIPKDIETKLAEYIDGKRNAYEEWYPITKEQHDENLEHIKDMYTKDFSLFIDSFKYDENGVVTDGIHQFLSNLGYDGIISDKEIVVFDASQVKSAETVTYAEDGSVIPLSQRFDPTNDDIRYSMPTQDSNGKVLSDGQMEYFKNSQARDEHGRLVPVYHTTNRGGFTVFDPEEADDHRSLFFSDSFEVSQTYGDYGSDSQFDTESYAAVAANKAAIEEMKEDSQAIVRRIKIKGIGSKEIDGETSGTGYEIFVDAEVKGENGEWHTIKEKKTINIDSDLIENADSVDDLDAAMEDLHGEAMYTAADMLGVDVEYLWDVYEIGSGWGFDMDYTPEEGIDAVDTDGARADLEEYGYDSSAYRGYYAVYLNLVNPFVIDGNRNNWNDLSNPSLGIIDREWEMFTDDSGRQVVTYTDNGGEAVEISDEEAEKLLGWDLYDKMATRWFEGDYGSVKTKWDTANNTLGRRSKTRDIAEYAYENGYDGVIIRNIADVNKRTANPFSDIYIAFSSAQIKDINNTDPTDNPDIRYSLPEDDEAMSHEAHNDAYDDSWEALVYYEDIIESMTDADLDDGFINHPMQVYLERLRKYGETDEQARRGRDKSKYRQTKFKGEEDWTEAFYAGLTWQASEMRFDDPVLEEGRTRMASSRDDFFNSAVAKWDQTWVTEGAVLDINSIRKPVRDLVMAVMQQSDTNRKYKSDTVKKTLIDMRLAFWYAQKGRIEIADALIWHSAMRMIQDVEFYDDSMYEEYKDLRHYMRTTRIQLGPEYWSDVEYQTFRKANLGRMKLVSGPTNVDEIYAELEEMFPGMFNSDEYMTPPEQLVHMADVLESIQPYKIAYSSEQCAALATDIASDLLDIIQNEGKAIESVADKYEAKIKAMKTRHAEAMLKVREQRDNAVKAEKAKFKEYKETQKEKGLHRKHFQSIQKTHKALSDRLLSNTADKNIPEQYKKELAKVLAAFDLQTVGSKKREAETGHVSQKKIRMGALIAALSNIEAKSGEFHVNDAITDIIDELLGKDVGNGFNRSVEGLTIDELNSGELARIDKLLKALLHEFNTYQSVKIKAKRQQVADIGKAQVDHAFEYAEQFGSRKDYNSVIGILDKIVNLDEMTAAYMFRQIDPNNEGLGLMFRELRLGFDHYVRNTEQLNEWMGKILGKYQNRGKFGPGKYGADQIHEWRSSNYARTFNLENGSISLTPAQMMSVYCLARRIQAYNHMTGAGIVVAPVYYDASIMSDIKQKVNTAKPVKLTEADIKQIVGQLTPEQREVADKLQQLMANQMAAWGNEASMNVLGIELFHEPDYFPIRSDKGGLTKDLDENQFVEAIRSFGFTKAVTPGARNAIMVDDIFSVVAEHCNNMNLYNSYSEAINDFMKVYNYRDVDERWGENTVAQAVAHAFSQKANTFIMQFIRDLNGNVSGNNTGIAKMYNDLLSKAKKASVFANGRVALQQPTAIARAFYLINPKYLKGIRIGKGDMREMFEHCPIALWKSWGYYDIQMGRSIEDVMMNNGNWLEDIETGLYGRLDNMTWTAIWQMVKAEMKDTHPEVKEGTDEYWELCNERMSEIVDLTQVVDSPMNRSHAMRSKNYLEKTATAFMSEPTLTFNMVKDGIIRSWEAFKSGNKAEAGSIFGKTMGVFLLQAALVSAMAALWDALRGKNPNGDDDDEEQSYFTLWWLNTLHNFVDEIEIWNKVYFVKDVSSMFQGYGVNNMALQGWKSIADGIAQLTGSRNVYSSKEWYENLLNGFGYVTGKPYGTLLKDMKAIYEWAGLDWKAVNLVGGYLDDTKERFNDMFGKDDKETVASSFMAILDGKKNGTEEQQADEEETESSVPSKEDLPDNLTDEQKDEIIKSANKRSKKAAEKEEAGQLDYDEMLYKALKSASGLEGEEYNKKVYSSVANGLKGYIAEGDYQSIGMMRTVIEQAGGDVDYFDQRVLDETKTAFKKSLGYDLSQEERWGLKSQWRYLVGHGMTAEEISSEIIYKSDLAKDMKVAYRLGDNGTIYEAMLPLVDAGLTEADMNRLYENRNRMDLSKYNGRYKDKLKSTGRFIWPTQGTITSGFGRRNAPTAGASSNHPAIDIGAPQGTAVVAADGGVVITAGSNGGYGNSVGIKHDDGTISYYNHLYAWNVKVGDSVGQGQQIGQVGSTGISTGPHLDFRLYKNGEYLNPLEYLDKRS